LQSLHQRKKLIAGRGYKGLLEIVDPGLNLSFIGIISLLKMESKMSLTKPAGVAFQLIGFIFFIFGFVLFLQFTTSNVIWGIILLCLGGWMVWRGRRKKERQ
jgi:hypothetical protein